MATAQTIADRALLRVRDPNQLIAEHTDANMLILINDVLHDIHQDLINIESNLVYAHGTITTVDGTIEYTPSFDFFMIPKDGIWLDDEEWFLKQVSEADKIYYDFDSSTSEPEAYYTTEDGDIGFLSVPDDAYTVHVQYIPPLTELSALTGTIPWVGIWDKAIESKLIMDMLEIQERDNSRYAIQFQRNYDAAMSITFQRGIRRRRISSDFFSPGDM